MPVYPCVYINVCFLYHNNWHICVCMYICMNVYIYIYTCVCVRVVYMWSCSRPNPEPNISAFLSNITNNELMFSHLSPVRYNCEVYTSLQYIE